MTKRKAKAAGKKKPIESYDHTDKKRANNPPVGLVTPQTDPDAGHRKTYEYDPHLDPQPVWPGKADYTSFEVPTVSLHVHERIDPKTIIEAVRKRNSGVAHASSVPKAGRAGKGGQDACATFEPLTLEQLPLFEQRQENLPLREAIEFYKHAKGGTNSAGHRGTGYPASGSCGALRLTSPKPWATLHSDTSRRFDRPKSGRVAVNVIKHLGDEVMKVFRVE